VCSKIKQGELPIDWVIGPKSQPYDLGDYLEKHNIKKIYSMAGMAIDISSLDRNVPIPENVHIETVTTVPGLRLWADVVSRGLWNSEPFEACLFEKLLGNPNYRFYLAFIDGEAVASSMLMLTSGVAEINMVSTLPEYRGRGIGTAMTTMPLLDAHLQGYELGVLQASKSGEPVYRKIGFKEYCRFNVFRYQPS
jgi:ribosomal protein S18 acetylase RimI-like enzyme